MGPPPPPCAPQQQLHSVNEARHPFPLISLPITLPNHSSSDHCPVQQTNQPISAKMTQIPSQNAKCRPSSLLVHGHPSTSPGLPLATWFLLSALLLDQMVGTWALRCYQTQTSLQQPVQGSATDCPMMAWSCIKSVDYTQGLVTRACQSSNCTLGQMSMSSAPICQNSSSYPPQTFCCCYGDGCNSSLGGARGWPLPLLVVVSFGILVIGAKMN